MPIKQSKKLKIIPIIGNCPFLNYFLLFSRYEEVVLWMDSVDVALKTILVECTHVVQFETEKAKFVVSSGFINIIHFVIKCMNELFVSSCLSR